MNDPVELEDNFVLVLSNLGYADPLDHAATHSAAGSDPITISPSQVTGLGTIATQAANSVNITGGTVSGVTLSSSAATITGGTVSGVTLSSSAATLTGGTINGVVIGGSTPAAGTFTNLTGTNSTLGTASATTLTLTNPLAVLQGGTGSTTPSGARSALGIGSMGTQNASAVAITGGSINATTIGASTAAAGTFTNLTATGTVSLTSALPIASGGTGATSASDARTALGLAIGTNVQAYDADLAAIAGLTSAANKGIYFTGAGTAATFDLTTLGRAIGGAANRDAVLASLGIVYGVVTLAAGTATVSVPGVTSSSYVIATHAGALIAGYTGHLVCTPSTDSIQIDSYTSTGAHAIETNDVNNIYYLVII